MREYFSFRAVRIVFVVLALIPRHAYVSTAQTNFTVLKSFQGTTNFGGFRDGALPVCSLIADPNGVLYGTASAGGASNGGALFRTKKDGTGFSVLRSFSGADGGFPMTGLLLDTSGVLFGTTRSGGSSNLGTIFRINRDGSGFSVLHSFLGGVDGMNPENELIQASDGFLYGVTPNGNGGEVQGTIYKINPDGSGYSVLFGFPGTTAGAQPHCRLFEASDGLLYGTASTGGAANCGLLFGISKDSGNYTILWFFRGSGDGATPKAGVIEASDNFLYGTTYSGGSGNAGTVYRISKNGSGHVIVRSFSPSGGDAANPQGEIFESSDGVLYGSTLTGGLNSYGAIFKLSKDGSGYSILHNFRGPSVDGDTPSSLLDSGNGAFFGTTKHGAGAVGSVFALTQLPLPPRILSESLSDGVNLLQFALSVGIPYQLLRTTNFASWDALATISSPSNGICLYRDYNLPQPIAFYRLLQQ